MKCQMFLSLSALERLLDPPNRGQLPGWERKSSNPFPTTRPQPPRLQLEQGRASPRKEYWRKSQGRLAAFAFQRLPFPPTSAPTPGARLDLSCAEGLQLFLLTARGWCCTQGMLWHQVRGRRVSSTLCLLTHRIYRVSNRNLPTTAMGIYPSQQWELIHHSNRNLSITAKCTETARAKWGNAPKPPPVPLALHKQLLPSGLHPLNDSVSPCC